MTTKSNNPIADALYGAFQSKQEPPRYARVTQIPLDANLRSQGYVVADIDGNTVQIQIGPGDTYLPGDTLMAQRTGSKAGAGYTSLGFVSGIRPSSGIVEVPADTTIGGVAYGAGDQYLGALTGANWWFKYGAGVWLMRQAATMNGAIGNLNGLYGYASAIWGSAFGEYGTGKINITTDPTNGFRIRNYNTPIFQADTAGVVWALGAFQVGPTGNIRGGQTAYNTGSGFWLGYDSTAYKFSIGNGTKALTYDGTDLRQNGAIIGSIGLGSEPAIQGWQMTCVFSSVDADTVAWESGYLILADGTTHAIEADETNSMTAKTYIYWNAVYPGVFLRTTTAADAMGAGKILIAVAVNGTVEARFQVFSGYGGLKISGGDIEARSIVAGNLTVTAGGANLLLNSTFQVDTNADDVADEWLVYNNTGIEEVETFIVPSGGVDNRAFQRLVWTATNTSVKGVMTGADFTAHGGVQGGWLPNSTYIISLYAKGSFSGAAVAGLAWNTPPATTTWLTSAVLTAAWTRYVVRITWGASVEANGRLFLHTPSAVTGTLDFDHVQLEQSDTPSAWKPFPSELEPGSVTADHIYGTTLSAIKVDTGELNMSGFLTIGAAGGIYQGTGTAGSPTTGLKVWNDSGVGRIAGYNAGVLQAGFGTDGKLYAGAGKVVLGVSGITIGYGATSGDAPSSVIWDDSGTERGRIICYNDSYYSRAVLALLASHVGIAANSISISGQGGLTLNCPVTANVSQGDYDFAIKGLNDANLLFVDASTDKVGIGTAAPTVKFSVGEAAAVHYDASTNERGFLVKMINRTGETSVKGTLVSCSTSADREVVKQANEYDTIGVIQQAGVAEGSEMWVWVNGSVCQVLLKNSTAVTHGQILIAADTDGRAIGIDNPGSGLPATETHFKECGHIMESKSAGTNVLALAMLHFN